MAGFDNSYNQSSSSNAGRETIEMNPREKAIRDLFVSEYMVDYDPIAAALRCGYQKQFAIEFSVKFMDEPYVQQKINEVKFQVVDDKQELEYNKKRIKAALMVEAHYHGPGSSHAARVAALGRLAALNGMEAPKVTANLNIHRGGVMAVPGIASLDEWEAKASMSQDQLVEHARNIL